MALVRDRLIRGGVLALAVALGLTAAAGSAQAPQLMTVRAGKAINTAYPFAVLEIGVDAHIWETVGLKLEISSFKGDAGLQTALTSGAVDVGLGSGPAMGYHSKGVPATAVAAMMGPPADMGIVVAENTPVKSVADFKGKRLGVTTAGSLTDWLVHELSRRQGWGPDGIQSVAMGATEARIAALQSGDIAGSVQDSSVGYELEEKKEGKVFETFGNFVPKFYTHVIFARDDLIAKNPDLVRRFLRGWFKTIAYMKTHKKETVASAMATLQMSQTVVSRSYDTDMPAFSTDGSWDPASIEVVRRSLKDLGIMDTEPDPKTMYTAAFVPVKI
jgi:NitT/TauT family transport system substrate-binding protein